MLELSVIALFTLLGVITQRVVGFGIAPLLSPIALMFFIPPVAVATTLIVGTLSCLLVLFQSRRHNVVIPAVIGRILLTAIPGLLLGSYVVTHIDKALLQIILGFLVIVAILTQEYVLPKPTRPLSVTQGISGVGFMVGLLNATAGQGAAPMALWLRTHTSTPDQIRQNLAAMFVTVNLCSLTAIYHLRPQTFGHQVATNFAVVLPMIFIGNVLGFKLMGRVNRRLYERLIVGVITLTGLTSISLGLVSKL